MKIEAVTQKMLLEDVQAQDLRAPDHLAPEQVQDHLEPDHQVSALQALEHLLSIDVHLQTQEETARLKREKRQDVLYLLWRL